MALSDDQRALLRLLAQREDAYEDIAALKGLSVEQVRAEVKDALAELQAASEAPAPSSPPPAREVAPEASEIIYGEDRVRASTAKPAKPPPRQAAKLSRKRPAGSSVPPERRRLVLLAGGALGVIAVLFVVMALVGGGDSDSGSSTTAGADTELSADESSKVTQAVLSAADGSDANGRGVFGRVGKEEVVLQVTAENLEPTDSGQSYTVWLYRSPKLTLRVGSVPVGEEGRLGARFAIPAELLAYVASGAFDQIYVSRTEDAAYQREVARAKKNKSLPRYTGETVLTGEITGPIAKSAGSGG